MVIGIEIIVGILAFLIAWRALIIQKNEIIRNSKINSLIHLSSMLQSKIDYHSKIINDCKQQEKTWKGHADKINNELRPVKEEIDAELINLISKYEHMPNIEKIKIAISSKK